MPKHKFNFLPFIFCLVIPLVIGALGGFLTTQNVQTWYPTINKPQFTPPNWIFGPVWTFLYILMGVSSYLVWQRRKKNELFKKAIAIYVLQLVFNLGWSFLFFYQHQIGLALVEILVLLALIVITGFLFYRINRIAGLLYIPYVLWVSFASYLTYSIYILN